MSKTWKTSKVRREDLGATFWLNNHRPTSCLISTIHVVTASHNVKAYQDEVIMSSVYAQMLVFIKYRTQQTMSRSATAACKFQT